MPRYLLDVAQRNSRTAHMCEGSPAKAMRAHPFNPQVIAVFAQDQVSRACSKMPVPIPGREKIAAIWQPHFIQNLCQLTVHFHRAGLLSFGSCASEGNGAIAHIIPFQLNSLSNAAASEIANTKQKAVAIAHDIKQIAQAIARQNFGLTISIDFHDEATLLLRNLDILRSMFCRFYRLLGLVRSQEHNLLISSCNSIFT